MGQGRVAGIVERPDPFAVGNVGPLECLPQLCPVAIRPEPHPCLRVREHVVVVRLVRGRLVAAAEHVDQRGGEGE